MNASVAPHEKVCFDLVHGQAKVSHHRISPNLANLVSVMPPVRLNVRPLPTTNIKYAMSLNIDGLVYFAMRTAAVEAWAYLENKYMLYFPDVQFLVPQ